MGGFVVLFFDMRQSWNLHCFILARDDGMYATPIGNGVDRP